MTDTFSKACLAVIAISLAIIAYAQVSGGNPPRPAMQAPPSATGHNTNKRCTQALEENRITLAALEAQIRNVPATVQTRDRDGEVTDESPNRLYEQLMLQIIQTKTELQVLEAKCGT